MSTPRFTTYSQERLPLNRRFDHDPHPREFEIDRIGSARACLTNNPFQDGTAFRGRNPKSRFVKTLLHRFGTGSSE